LFTPREYQDFLQRETLSQNSSALCGHKEYIYEKTRYCLYLEEADPSEIEKMPEVGKIIDLVRRFRLQSKSASTLALAQTPERFHVKIFPLPII
jgi:hypothetical protein